MTPPALALADAAQRLRRKPGRPPLSDEEKRRRADQRLARRAAELAGVAPRLLDIPSSARYLGVSPWTARALVENGTLRRVLIPMPEGRDMRRVLVDREDLDRLITTWKDTT